MENKNLTEEFAAFLKDKKLYTPEELKKGITPVPVNKEKIEKWRKK